MDSLLFKQALTLLDRMGHKDLLVVPLALIGSTHLMDYLGGERSDSIYALLAEEGYNVDIWNEVLVKTLCTRFILETFRSSYPHV